MLVFDPALGMFVDNGEPDPGPYTPQAPAPGPVAAPPPPAPSPLPIPTPTPSPWSTPAPRQSAPVIQRVTASAPPASAPAPFTAPIASAPPPAVLPAPGTFQAVGAAPVTPPALPPPGVAAPPFVPPPRPVPAGGGGETPAAAAALGGQNQPGLARLGPLPSAITPADPRSVLSSIYASRGIDPDNPGGPLGSLGNVDYYLSRLQDTGGWQGGNIGYWKGRLAGDLDLSRTGLGGPPPANLALIGAGLGNQPGAYADQAVPSDERTARLRGSLLSLMRQPGQAEPLDRARQILEPQEAQYAEGTRSAVTPTSVTPGPGVMASPSGLDAYRQALMRRQRMARAQGNWPGAADAQQAWTAPFRGAVLSSMRA